jgi:UDP-N-acetylglucosamine:LPS N-acetylglucosamine transferase
MDLAVLGRPAIFVPTPGQTEQEYLARRFHADGVFYSESQRQFNLARALEKSRHFTGIQADIQHRENLIEAVDRLLVKLSAA